MAKSKSKLNYPDRKRTLFGDDQRLMGEYKVFRKDGIMRLRADARDPTFNEQSG